MSKMLMIDVLLDSLSRCSGIPTERNSYTITPMVTRAKGITKEDSNDKTSSPQTLSMRIPHIYAKFPRQEIMILKKLKS